MKHKILPPDPLPPSLCDIARVMKLGGGWGHAPPRNFLSQGLKIAIFTIFWQSKSHTSIIFVSIRKLNNYHIPPHFSLQI